VERTQTGNRDRHAPADGRLGGRYVLQGPIGQGRSTVFRAVDTRLRREVAIKQVLLASGDEDRGRVRSRALREARAAARLNHPRVVAVYDILEEDDALWLVMELVEAPSLSQLVAASGPLGHRRAAGIGMDVLGALAAAHAVGVVHRDVKPANVLVTEERAKLADFGVATVRDQTRVTATGLVIGSPAFMAPEQAMGQEVGPPADLWSLGATLFFSVEGIPPFGGDSPIATVAAVVHAEPRPTHDAGPLSPLITALLTKDPSGRPSPTEVGVALAAVANGGRDAGRGLMRGLARGLTTRSRRREFTRAPGLIGRARSPGDPPSPASPSSPPTTRRPAVPATWAKTRAPGEATGQTVQAPAIEPAPGSAGGPAPGVVDEPGVGPAPGVGREPAGGVVRESVAEPAGEPLGKSGAGLAGGPAPGVVDESGAGLAGGPTPEPAVEPVSEPVRGSAPKPAVESAAGPSRRSMVGRDRRPALVALVAAAALLGLVPSATGRVTPDSGDDRAGQEVADSADSGDNSAPGPAGAEEEPTTPPGGSAAGEAADPPDAPSPAAVPEDWVPYEHAEGGYRILHPPGWQVEPSGGPRVDIRDPSTGAYLRIDWTTEPRPDPVADWQDQAGSFAGRHPSYEEIQIAPYDYRDYNAALWEFRYEDGGARLHVGNLGLVTADGDRAYALYFQTPESLWADSQELFAQFREAFQPT
jgi:eukaryotic-like serine/threonine-protein kinase